MAIRQLLAADACRALLGGRAPALMRRVASAPGEVGMSAITFAELRVALVQSEARSEGHRRLKELTSEVAVLPFDERVARAYGAVRTSLEQRGGELGPLEILVAAHALSLGAALVTDAPGFDRVRGLAVERWEEVE